MQQQEGSGFKNFYQVSCLRNGEVAWEEGVYNLVTIEGLDHFLSTYFKGNGYTAEHYITLNDGAAVTAQSTLVDFMASQEFTGYEDGRKKLVFEGPDAEASPEVRMMSNESNPAIFRITQDTTITGIGVVTVQTGDEGVLLSGAPLGTNREVIAGDILNIVCVFTQRSY